MAASNRGRIMLQMVRELNNADAVITKSNEHELNTRPDLDGSEQHQSIIDGQLLFYFGCLFIKTTIFYFKF